MSMYVDSLVIRRWKTTNGNIHDSSVAHYIVDSVKDYSYILGDWAYDTSEVYDYVIENTHTVPVIDTNKRRGIISNKLKVNRKVGIGLKREYSSLDSLKCEIERTFSMFGGL